MPQNKPKVTHNVMILNVGGLTLKTKKNQKNPSGTKKIYI